MYVLIQSFVILYNKFGIVYDFQLKMRNAHKENGRIEKINPIIKDRDSFQQKTLNTSSHV